MDNMIPAAKIAAAALRQVRAARDNVPTSYHETDKINRQTTHLDVAAELLALIANTGPMASVADDGAVKMIEPPSAPVDEINF